MEIDERTNTLPRLPVEAPIWQRDFFDRFLRSADSYSEKWEYVRDNPVRAGLVRRPEDWSHQGVTHDLAL
jgi:putative transposase